MLNNRFLQNVLKTIHVDVDSVRIKENKIKTLGNDREMLVKCLLFIITTSDVFEYNLLPYAISSNC